MFWRLKNKYYYPLRQFFSNCWKFRKELANFYSWNYDLGLFRRSIELNKVAIEKYANEVPESRLKKLAKMERAIYLLKCFEEDNFIELAEKVLGFEMEHGNIWFEPIEDREGCSLMWDDLSEVQISRNRDIVLKTAEIQNEMWIELWQIIRGQDCSKFDKEKEWFEQFDGSDLRSWWD